MSQNNNASKISRFSSQISTARVVVTVHFPQASLSLPAATAVDLEIPCVCACQSNLPKHFLKTNFSISSGKVSKLSLDFINKNLLCRAQTNVASTCYY